MFSTICNLYCIIQCKIQMISYINSQKFITYLCTILALVVSGVNPLFLGGLKPYIFSLLWLMIKWIKSNNSKMNKYKTICRIVSLANLLGSRTKNKPNSILGNGKIKVIKIIIYVTENRSAFKIANFIFIIYTTFIIEIRK